MGNFEVNFLTKLDNDNKDQIIKYIQSLKKFSIPIDTKEAYDFMSNPIQEGVNELLKFFYSDIRQKDIKSFERDIDQYSTDLKSAIEKVESDKWDASQFKDKYLLTDNWAIAESKHTELFSTVKGSNPDTIFRNIQNMIKNVKANPDKDFDEIVDSGRMESTLGSSVLTEILHKYFIKNYPIRNKRSGWGLSIALNTGTGPDYVLEKITYVKFIEYCDKVYGYYVEWMTKKGIALNIRYKYYYLDRLFLKIYESDRYSEAIRMYNRSRKDNAHY